MLQFKKISVNLALVVSLAAFASAQYAHAQTENIKLPLPIDELEIQAAVQGVIVGTDLNEIRRQTRDTVMVEQVKRLPLLQQIRNTVGNTVRTRVMAVTSTMAINAQMNAMQDPVNPDGIPMFLAPKFE